MHAAIVRYRVKPGRAEENADLIRAVYAELEAEQPPGFRYQTFLLEDGVTFLHIGVTEDGHETPLPRLESFQRFRDTLSERSEEPPHTTNPATRIGVYGR